MSTLDFYNEHALEFVSGSMNADMTEHYTRFLNYVPTGSIILDLGCGSGRDTAYFRNKGYEVTPIDGSKEICLLAEKYLNTTVRCLTFEELDYANCFDAVWACASLLHVSRNEMPIILKKIHTSLKNEGILYASFKYGKDETIRDGRFFSNYTDTTIQKLFLSEYWSVEDLWVSSDVRPNRQTEQWVNIIVRKCFAVS